MSSQSRPSTALSRRALVTAGAGWALGTGSLLLPAAIDEAVARKGGNGGKKEKNRNGKGKGDKRRGQGKGMTKSSVDSGDISDSGDTGGTGGSSGSVEDGSEDFMPVRLTFVNGTAFNVYLWPYNSSSHQFVGPLERTRFEVPYLVRDYAAAIDIDGMGGQGYLVYAENPTVSLPYVKILDTKIDRLIFNEKLEKMQEVESDRFRLKRLADSDAVLFVLTLLADESS